MNLKIIKLHPKKTRDSSCYENTRMCILYIDIHNTKKQRERVYRWLRVFFFLFYKIEVTTHGKTKKKHTTLACELPRDAHSTGEFGRLTVAAWLGLALSCHTTKKLKQLNISHLCLGRERVCECVSKRERERVDLSFFVLRSLSSSSSSFSFSFPYDIRALTFLKEHFRFRRFFF